MLLEYDFNDSSKSKPSNHFNGSKRLQSFRGEFDFTLAKSAMIIELYDEIQAKLLASKFHNDLNLSYLLSRYESNTELGGFTSFLIRFEDIDESLVDSLLNFIDYMESELGINGQFIPDILVFLSNYTDN
jgi:hypothetical protein